VEDRRLHSEACWQIEIVVVKNGPENQEVMSGESQEKPEEKPLSLALQGSLGAVQVQIA